MNSQSRLRNLGGSARMARFALVCLLVLLGCSQKGTDGGPSAVGLSGTLSLPNVQAFEAAKGLLSAQGGIRALAAIDPSTLTIKCLDAAKIPPVTVTGTIGASGGFKVDLTPVAGDPVTCSVLDNATPPNVIATFVFQDSSKTSLSGGASESDTLSINKPVDLGTVVLNRASQEVDASASLLGDAGASGASAFDFTGNYLVGNVDFTLPPGYVGPCAAGSPHDGPGHCDGPTVGQTLFLKRIAGKSFTPDAACTAAANGGSVSSCNGTTGSDPEYGIMVWESQAGFEACGSRLGFTYAEAKAFAHVDLTDSGIAEGAPVWSTVLPNNDPLVDGWKDQNATAMWGVQRCESIDAGGKTLWRCHDPINNTYSLGLGGGCVDSAGNPVNVQNWSQVSYPQGQPACTSTQVTEGSFTLNKNVCTGTYQNAPITCTSEGGIFYESDNSPADPSKFDWSNTQLVAQGTLCSAIPDNYQLAKLQCYANAYWQIDRSNTSGVCLRQLRTNWGATDAAHFLESDGPAKANGEFAVEKLEYSPSGTVFHFRHIEHDYRGVQAGSNNWTACDVKQVMTITGTKVDNQTLIVKFVQENHLIDNSKTACVANQNQLGIGTVRGLFKLEKQ